MPVSDETFGSYFDLLATEFDRAPLPAEKLAERKDNWQRLVQPKVPNDRVFARAVDLTIAQGRGWPFIGAFLETCRTAAAELGEDTPQAPTTDGPGAPFVPTEAQWQTWVEAGRQRQQRIWDEGAAEREELAALRRLRHQRLMSVLSAGEAPAEEDEGNDGDDEPF